VRVGTRKVKSGNCTGGDGTDAHVFNYGNKRGPEPRGHADADGTETMDAWQCVEGCPVAELDRQSGDRPGMSSGGAHRPGYKGGIFGSADCTHTNRGDDGGASRFFFCAKASRAEREFGCERLPARKGHEAVDREEDSAGTRSPRAGAGRMADEVRNIGPCVKPIKLTKYLATLARPPKRTDGPRRILIPYCGTGSEAIGALRAGWEEIVGIQRVSDADERAYVEIARARLSRWEQVRPDMDEAEACGASKDEKRAAEHGQTDLFGKVA
jgi:hypothetical protein